MLRHKTSGGLVAPKSSLCRSIGREPGTTVNEGMDIRIEWPQCEHGRSRNIITRSGVRRRYVVPCFRDGDREAHCESKEERDAAILLDANAGITFQEQPAKIVFNWRNEVVTHYPDLLVVDDRRREFWECKSNSEAEDLYIRRRTEALNILLSPLGYAYRLVTTSLLIKPRFIENARIMRRRAKAEIDDNLLFRMKGLTKSISAKEIFACESINACDDGFTLLCSALYRGIVRADLTGSIDLDMNISPSHDGDEPWLWQLLNRIN